MAEKTCKDCCYFWDVRNARGISPNVLPDYMGECCFAIPTVHGDKKSQPHYSVSPDVHSGPPRLRSFL